MKYNIFIAGMIFGVLISIWTLMIHLKLNIEWWFIGLPIFMFNILVIVFNIWIDKENKK